MGFIQKSLDENGKKGRMDVYDLETNTFYEIKTDEAIKRGAAKDQIEQYQKSSIYSLKFLLQDCFGKKPVLGEQYIEGTVYYGIWRIEYKSLFDGKIGYNAFYKKDEPATESTADKAVGAALIAGGIALANAGWKKLNNGNLGGYGGMGGGPWGDPVGMVNISDRVQPRDGGILYFSTYGGGGPFYVVEEVF